jgi:hypothetical protein
MTPCDVYVFQRGLAGPVKIGISKDVPVRAKCFGEINVLHRQPFDRKQARLVERVAHALLKEKRLNGEWFDVSPGEAISAIQSAVSLIEGGRHDDLFKPNKPITLCISEPLLELLDEARRKERDIPGRAEMIRRLIERTAPKEGARAAEEVVAQ